MGDTTPNACARPRPPGEKPLLALVVALVFLSAVTQVTTPDTFIHLSLGRWMWENGTIPLTNLLSFTQPERAATDHEWLFQAALYGAWRLVGISGATLLKAALVAAAFGLVLATALRKGSGVVVACLVVLVAAAAARFRFTLRPQVVAMLLLSACLFAFERWRQGRPRWLVVLPPLQVLWANFHGSAAFGCGLMLACAAAETLRHYGLRIADCGLKSANGDRKSEISSRLLWLWATALALFPATMLNPNGIGQLTFPFSHAAAQSELGLKELLLDRASIKWADLGGRHIFFALLCVGAIPALRGWWVSRDITEAGLFAGLLCAAMHSERFIELFAVAAAPIVASGIGRLRSAECGMRNVKRAAVSAAMCVALAVIGILHGSPALPFGVGIAPGFFPEEEVAWIQQNHPHGNLFNEFEHGGYIYWTARRPVFLDSRGMPSYAPAFVRDYVDMWTSRERWRQVLDRHDISVALVERRPLKAMFATDPAWRLAYQGPVSSVYVRKP